MAIVSLCLVVFVFHVCLRVRGDAALAWAYWGFWCKCYLEEAPNAAWKRDFVDELEVSQVIGLPPVIHLSGISRFVKSIVGYPPFMELPQG